MILKRLGKTPLIREGAPLWGVYLLYSCIRLVVARNSPYEAFNNAFKIIRLERELGIFYELTLQEWLIEHAKAVVYVANEFYTLGYFPVLIACGVLLYRSHPNRFQIFKLTFLLGLGFALISFSLFPLAPPRMLPELGFVDTQKAFGSNLYNNKSVVSFYNPYAAMPSLHFGWALLVGIMAYSVQRRLFKVIAVLYPGCMALVIVATGHHYFLDIVGGGVVISLAYALVTGLPYLVKELASIPAGMHGSIHFREKPSRARASRSSLDDAVSPWARKQREKAQRQMLRSSIAALLTGWRQPW